MDRPDALPWVQTPHWVLLSRITAEAKTVYAIIAMHVNRSDPANRESWPTRETIAEIAGWSRPQTVDRYIRELEKIGAITVVRGRHPANPLIKRNYYSIVLAMDPAPMDTVGDLSLADFYRRVRQESPVQIGGAQERTSDEVAPELAPEMPDLVLEEVTEVRNSAPPEMRAGAPRDVRASAQELEELELDEVEQEQEDHGLRTNLDSLVEAPAEHPTDSPVVIKQRKPPRLNVGIGTCGMNKCQNGMYVYNLAGDRRRCTICNPRVKAGNAA